MLCKLLEKTREKTDFFFCKTGRFSRSCFLFSTKLIQINYFSIGRGVTEMTDEIPAKRNCCSSLEDE